MKCRGGRGFLIVALTMALAASIGPQRSTPEMRPPSLVVVVCVDCLRGDQLGCYGCAEPTSPRIDLLARDSLVFDNAYTNSNWTKPSIASFFTGLLPSEHGVIKLVESDEAVPDHGMVLSDRALTLAEVFSARGYRTAAFVYQMHLAPEYGFAQGFETYKTGPRNAEEIVQLFVDWYDSLRPGERAFAYLHFLDCHSPYNFPRKKWTVFGPTDAVAKGHYFNGPGGWKQFRDEVHAGKRDVPPELPVQLLNMYQGDVRFVDGAVEKLVDYLSRKGGFDESLFALFADHGENFFEHRVFGHDPPYFYDEQIRIPMIVKLPESWRMQPGRVERQVQTIDLTATLSAAAGAPALGRGSSLIRTPRRAVDERYIITESEIAATVVRGDFKAYLPAGAMPATVQRLWDPVRDPSESRDFSQDNPQYTAALESYMEAWRRSAAESSAALNTSTKSARLSPENIKALRALGYIR